VAKPPVRRTPKTLLVPRDVTETSRQGQGIGDIEAMKQMAGIVGKEALANLPYTGEAMAAEEFRQAAKGGDKLGMSLAALSAMPMGHLVGSVAKNMGKEAAKAAAKEAKRVASRDAHFPIQVFHSTRSPKGIKEFKAKIHSGAEWHDLPGVHVGTLKAATQRATDYQGHKFEATPLFDKKTGAPVPGQVEFASSIMPLRMRAEKPFLNPQGEPFSEVELRQAVRKFAGEGGYLKQGQQYFTAAQKKAAREDFAKKLLGEGYDVIPYRNEVEDAGSLSYLVLNPNRLRSEFAKFDQRKLNSANLSAGLAGLFTGGAAARAMTRGREDGGS